MSTSMTEEPFTIFHKFPPEVQLEILRQCSEGDLVCLSLTCRDMRYLAKPLLPEKPDLSKVDQLGSTPDMPQDYMDSNCICRNGTKGCKGARGSIVAYDPDTHRNRRHYYKKRYAACYECRAYPPEHPVCQVAGCKKHCACISCPLFMRLRDWMGSRKYCRPCNKFTTRRKTNNGRCLHGRKKVRKTPNNHWTTRKGLSYGYRWWRRWGTHNVDNEAYQPDARPRINARIV